MKKLVFFISLTLVLSACNPLSNDSSNGEISPSLETGSPVQTMPEDMPNDFGFSIQFGVEKRNEINTYDNTVTKDLIADGTTTVDLTLTDQEMDAIYREMKDVHIVAPKKFIPEPINGTICSIEPSEEDEWEITINGETITHSVSGAYCDPTHDTKQLIKLRNYVFSIVKSKEAYMELPNSQGGYE